MAQKPVLESAVMDVLWSADGWLTPREVRLRLHDDHQVAYTTVMTVLVRLTAKGRVVRRRAGRAYAYRVVETREEFAAARMGEMLATAVDRSSALGHFLATLTSGERAELREWLEKRG